MDQRLQKYARVLVQRGVHLKKGQKLYLEIPPEGEGLAAAILEEVARAQGGPVLVNWKSDQCILAESLYSFTTPEDPRILEYAAQGAAYLRVDGPDLEGAQALPMAQLQQRALREQAARRRFRDVSKAQTCIACVPCTAWAKAVFPALPPEQALQQLWEEVYSCVRANEKDPLLEWDKFLQGAAQHTRVLNEKQYRAFHYKSGKTDLMVQTLPEHSWSFGGPVLEDGTLFMPNMPTEEVAAVPFKFGTEGVVASTRPLNYQGRLIDNFTLHFEQGKVVAYHANTGQDALESILQTDAGSCFLGEIALVDQQSPIARRNRIFYTTLYDENAACHLALGQCAGSPAPWAEGMAPAELERHGVNTSAIHVDFMVGSDDLCILGLQDDGRWEEVFHNGSWVL